jgi:hypothetical protein
VALGMGMGMGRSPADKARQRASNREHDEAWVNHLGSRAWVSWARAVVQQDHVKIDLIKRVSLMLRDWTAEITRDEIQRRSRRQYSWQLIAT